MYCDNEFINYVAEMLEPLGEISVKRLFGGHALCVNDCAVALAFEETVYFKVDSNNKPDYIQAGSQPFTYEKKGKIIEVSNWEMPASVLEDQDMFVEWAEKSYKVAHKAKKKK